MLQKIRDNNSIKIGFLFLVGAIVFFFSLNYLKRQNIFKPQTTYKVIYNNINGLQQDSPISINGYNVGVVSKIQLISSNGSKILVTLNLKEELKIPKNSIAKIVSSDIMGGKSISLELSNNLDILNIGDTLKSAIEFDLMAKMNTTLMPIADNLSKLIVSVESLISSFDKDVKSSIKKDIPEILNNLKMSTENFAQLTSKNGKVNTIFKKLDNLTDTITNGSRYLNKTIRNMSQISDSLKESKLHTAINNANSNLEILKQILKKTNSTEGTIGLLLNDKKLYNNLDSLTYNLDVLIKDLKENPKRYVKFSLF